MFDIDDLRTFVEVADAAGITPAARRLGLAKSIVSRRLARLENELGAQLLARTTRGAALSEAGTAFREHAARICAEMDLARETLAPSGELRGRFRLALPISFGATHLAPLLVEMARRHPLLHVHADYSDNVVDLVAEGFDAAVRVGHLADSNLVARRIGPVYARLVASPDYVARHGAPHTPQEVHNHEAIMQRAESWRFLDEGKVVSVNPKGRVKANNGAALVAAVVAGLGIAALPDFLVDEHLASGKLLHIMTRYPLPTAGIYVVRPPGAHASRKVRVLSEMLIERFGEACARVGAAPAPPLACG